MVIVKLMGGLGNQMFQYALAKNYKLLGEKVFLDTSAFSERHNHITRRDFELLAFKIDIPRLPKPLEKFVTSDGFFWKAARRILRSPIANIVEKSMAFDKHYLEARSPSRIIGYFQTEEYFKHISDELRRDFTFGPLTPRNDDYARQIDESNSVSLHIRRGDYANDELTNRVHGLLPLSYYEKAIAIVNAAVTQPKYFIFTDDPAWAHRNLSAILPKFIVVEGNLDIGSSWEDMFLISRCKHNVIANSSFSWWGAWLNSNPGKTVIAPENWCKDPDLNRQTKYLVPTSWTRVEN